MFFASILTCRLVAGLPPTFWAELWPTCDHPGIFGGLTRYRHAMMRLFSFWLPMENRLRFVEVKLRFVAKMRFLDVMGLSSQRCRCQIGNAQIKDFCKSFELQDLTRIQDDPLPAGFSNLRFTTCTGDSVWWTFQVCRWVLASSFIARPAMSCCEGRWRCQHSDFWVR